MIALMDSSLIAISGAREELIAVLKDKDGLAMAPTALCRIEPAKPSAKDDFVVMKQGRLIEAGVRMVRFAQRIVAQQIDIRMMRDAGYVWIFAACTSNKGAGASRRTNCILVAFRIITLRI